MKEELTTKMHMEFTVDAETEVKHKAFTLWSLLGATPDKKEITETAEGYGITYEQAIKYREVYFALLNR